MSEQASNELRAFMEQTAQALREQTERTMKAFIEQNERNNQLVLQALQNISNHNTKEAQSNHSENHHPTPSKDTRSRPPRPSFLPEEAPISDDNHDRPMGNVDQILADYCGLDPELRDLVTFKDYCDAKLKTLGRNERHPPAHKELQNKLSKVTIPNYDGEGKVSARSWVQKLDTYLSLSPMTQSNAIKFAILHLSGVAHEWWHHGFITQGHQLINTYEEFTQKLIKRFDQKHPEWYFQELTQLRQQGTI